jgi:outer membrane protein assembly factor BamC
LVLKKEDPRIGIMETDWAENRADIPEGPVRSVLKYVAGAVYSAPTRDKYRVRLERTADGGTDIYVTHYGVEEVAVGGMGNDRSTTTKWQPRPADPELEAEMLNRLLVYLGAADRRAATAVARADKPTGAKGTRSRLTTVDGQPALVIEAPYDRSWRLVGLALDSSNFVVEDQNRNQGRYTVEYRDIAAQPESEADKGLLSGLAFWRDKPPPKGTRYQVRLAGQGEQTMVVVQNAAGQPEQSPAAQQLLESLRDVVK